MEQAHKVLENLGYEPKLQKSTSGSPLYLLTFHRDNFHYVFYVSLSTDRKYLWLELKTAPLTGPDQVRANGSFANILMAPFCVHDCLHTHWRWAPPMIKWLNQEQPN